jgi:hypothetical protein
VHFALAFVAVPVVDRKAGAGTAEMETIAGSRSLSPIVVGTVVIANADNLSGLAVVEIDARSIPLLLIEKRKMKTMV